MVRIQWETILLSSVMFHLFIYLYFNDALSSLAVYLTLADCQYPIKRDLCGTVTDDQLRLDADLIIWYAAKGLMYLCLSFSRFFLCIMSVDLPALIFELLLRCVRVLSLFPSLGWGRSSGTRVIAPSVFSNVRENSRHADHNHIRQHFTK